MARISFVSGGGSGTPGGSDTQVQFNDGGAFSGSSGLVYDKATGTLTATKVVASSGFTGSLQGTATMAADSTLFDGRSSNTFAGLTANTFTGIQTFSNVVTGTSAYFSGDVIINGTASISILETRNQQSLAVGDKYIVIMSASTDHVGLDGAGLLFGSGSVAGTVDENGSHGYLRYRNAHDKLEIFPGLRVSGSLDVTGGISSSAISGSLTKLTDGSSYLIAGSNITITSASNGSVTIAASAGAEYIPAQFFVEGTIPVFNGTQRSYVYKACAITSMMISVGTAATGSAINVRINKNGSSLITGSLATGSNYNKVTGLSASLVEGDYLTLDVTQVGSTYPGYDLTIKTIAG